MVRAALCFNSWFKKAAFGMNDFEILARGSAAALRWRSELRLLTCFHTVHPFRYPNYYDPDQPATAWVHQVRPEEIRCLTRVISQDDDDNGANTLELDPGFVVPHPTRDLAMLRFKEPTQGERFLKEQNVRIFDVETGDVQRAEITMSSKVFCHGHRTIPKLEDDQDVSEEFPAVVQGSVEYILPASRMHGQDGQLIETPQVLAATDATLTMGMCGGPVVDENDSLVGIVEGILTPQVASTLGVPEMASIVPISQVLQLFHDERTLSS